MTTERKISVRQLEQVISLLLVARRASFKLWTMYERGEMQRRYEVDVLIDAKGSLDTSVETLKKLCKETKG